MNYKILEFNLGKPTYFKLKINNQKTSELEPLLELYKGKLFCYIIKSFINNCINQFGSKIFSIKKSSIRTLTNLLSSWIFSLYIDYDFSDDYLLPTNYTNITTLKETLIDLCKFDTNITNVDEKIDNVLTNLINIYEIQLNLFTNYQNSELFKNTKNKYKINKKNKNNFYKFDICVEFDIKNKRLINILNNLLIPIEIYDKLSKCYSGPKDKMDNYIWAILFRYQLLGSNNHQLAVLSEVMNKMNNDYHLNFECFASVINNTFNHYCSIYYDLEQYFGSVGSFFNIIPLKGTFGFNPPYQKDVINKGINKLFYFLDNTSEELTFIITIPIWDTYGQLLMNNTPNINYGDFEIIKEIKESKYFRGLRMISKEKFTYIDHNFGLYKNKTIQDTYVIILSTKSINNNILDDYTFDSPN